MVQIGKISPCLWFDGQAEAAARFYVSVFKEARILAVEEISSGPAEGNAIVGFELEGLRFTALDGGPMFEITPAISFEVSCDSQEEIDYFWKELAEGGETQMCGWLQRPLRRLVAGRPVRAGAVDGRSAAAGDGGPAHHDQDRHRPAARRG